MKARPSKSNLRNYQYVEEPRLREWLAETQNMHSLQKRMNEADLDVGVYASFVGGNHLETLALYVSSTGLIAFLWISPWKEEAVYEDRGVRLRFSDGGIVSSSAYDDSAPVRSEETRGFEAFVNESLAKMDGRIREAKGPWLKEERRQLGPIQWVS